VALIYGRSLMRVDVRFATRDRDHAAHLQCPHCGAEVLFWDDLRPRGGIWRSAASPGSCPRSSVEEVSNLLMAAPGPGLKYRAALNVSYGAGLRAREVCNLKISDIDSDRMLIYVEQGKSSHLRPRVRGPMPRMSA
jgi:integrase